MLHYKVPIFHFTTVTSTNDIARELLAQEDIVVVYADEQTHGRGRHGKIWNSERRKNLYYSLGIRQNKMLTAHETASYQAVGGMAAIDALRKILPDKQFRVKYPNDIMVKMDDASIKKISGILVEHDYLGSIVQSTIIGIGINIEQTIFDSDLQNKATSLAILGCSAFVQDVFDIVHEKIINRLNDKNIMDVWRQELNIEGKLLTMRDGKETFTIQKVLDDGTLLADTGDNCIIISSGESYQYKLDFGDGNR